MGIYANKPIVVHNGSNVSVCFEHDGKTVSLTLDDSCGQMKKLGRGSIELYRNCLDVRTLEVFADCLHEDDPEGEFLVVPASIENFERAMKWLKKSEWGFDAQPSSTRVEK